jgi:hypothetical protein
VDSLLKNPSTPLPSTIQGLKKPCYCSVLVLKSKCMDAVLDYRLVLYNDFFRRLWNSANFALTAFSEVGQEFIAAC